MISQAAERALRVIVHLGSQGGEPRTAAQIADATGTSVIDLEETLSLLSRSGILAPPRRVDHGFMLLSELTDVTVLDVVRAVEAFHPIEDCPLGQPAQTSGLCPLHRPMDHVSIAAKRALGRTTISELLHEPNLVCSLPCISEPVGRHSERATSPS
jgi:Rrf2 family protein